jgi:hypothetical protein
LPFKCDLQRYIAGAERPGLMLDIMLSMRAQGIGVVQGVIDSMDGRLSANVFYVIDERTGVGRHFFLLFLLLILPFHVILQSNPN